MNFTRIALIVVALLALLPLGVWIYYEQIANPRTTRELLEHPTGERARKVMLITLPSGRRLPVNYLREEDRVYAGADGGWWKELEAGPAPVTVLVRGEALRGTGRVVLDDPEYTRAVFARLRPNALEGFGRLVEVQLEADSESARGR